VVILLRTIEILQTFSPLYNLFFGFNTLGDLFPKSARPDRCNNIKIWTFDFLFTLGQFKDTIDKYTNIDSYPYGHWGIFTAKQQHNLGPNYI
jgi:hypothetical protein